MSGLVVDTSAFVKVLVREDGSERMLDLLGHELLAPDHLLLETANVLWKQVRWRGLPQRDALDALETARRFAIELTPATELVHEALALASQLPHPPYDTLYLLLALKGGRALATADARMRQAAESLGIKVEWVGA